ncbi:MAG: FAD-binding oxidoreductase [Bacteroidetes bacterium]|nr:FAD-binding oxidoreductase [Bacteroidota bacterium]
MLSGPYSAFRDRLTQTIPAGRLFSDDLHTLAYGADASFYRLIPKLVVRVENEQDVITVLREAAALKLPVTFRAAGTSLSGQAVTDSVLVSLGQSWKAVDVSEDLSRVTLQPGVIGGDANAYLAPLGKKIGPDPASINAATVGGIAANNAGGMCCGTAQNSYQTLSSMRIVFADGSVLDTRDPQSRQKFESTHARMLSDLLELSHRTRSNAPLADRIRRKFKLKNTTGYSLNALVDFEDPIDILQHLLIGSEGTLGFISEITYRTVPELPFRASSLLLFPDIETACRAAAALKQCPVDAVELMDRASLRSVQDKPGMPSYLKSLDVRTASLLVETRASSQADLDRQISMITKAVSGLPRVKPLEFTSIPEEYTVLWNMRKGLFPSIGAMRETGTTVIIEDVAFPVPRLAEATMELQSLFDKHRYHDAIIFGHALEGNLHFVFKQDFNNQEEIARYKSFLDDIASMVVNTYDGSLKAEHGTGRNMAPFVELEWGAEAYAIMKEIKKIFDPENLLNPGVILNTDPSIHLKNLKHIPAAHPLIDKCTECGFCEVQCPSRNLTFTPRQRIVAIREIVRLGGSREDRKRHNTLQRAFTYPGEETCATDGLCATSCPVDIDTGSLVKTLREESNGSLARTIVAAMGRNMRSVTAVLRLALNGADLLHRMLGTSTMQRGALYARRITLNTIPLWNPALPRSADPLPAGDGSDPNRPAVVYFPSCINRTMGVEGADRGQPSLSTVTVRLLSKAGYHVVIPENVSSLCCGMAFSSKGFKREGERKAPELEEALMAASDNGTMPVLFDMSPCLLHTKQSSTPGLNLYEPVEFVLDHLTPRLAFTRLPITVAIHTTCSAQKMGLTGKLKDLAELCAERVVVPEGVGCCGWAGDRGFTFPELNESALQNLKSALPADCSEGYSTSRTCEIGLSLHSGIPYRSIFSLVDRCTQPGRNH